MHSLQNFSIGLSYELIDSFLAECGDGIGAVSESIIGVLESSNNPPAFKISDFFLFILSLIRLLSCMLILF